jgi:hypothetical protein
MGMRAPSALFLVSLLAAACSRPLVVTPPPEAVRQQRQKHLLAVLRSLAEDGDWLVIRGYHGTDHLISAVTNAPFSHAAVLDRERDQVIEADHTGVHLTSLDAFAPKVHRLMLVRPQWAGQGRNRDALLKVRDLVGRPYDFSGLVGINHPERYYCTELAVVGYRPWVKRTDHVPPVIPPSELHYWGRVIWDSGPPPSEGPSD